MIYEKDKLYVVHYDYVVILLTDNINKANELKEIKYKEYPSLGYKVSTVEEYGILCYELGGEHEREGDEY